MPDRRTFLTTSLCALAAPVLGAPLADYRAQLSAAYGGPIEPADAHQRAQGAAKAAQRLADRLLRSQGLRTGGVAERLRILARDPRWLFADSEAGRDRAVFEMNARVSALRPSLDVAFGDLPLSKAEVRRMPAADVAAGRGGYREPPGPGKPGIYYVDLKTIGDRPAWSLPSVAFHEVIPGHLLQLPLQAAPSVPPERIKAAGAYFEAWAIYAEQLSADLGAYHRDPLGEIGYIQWRLFRIGRIVADTGLHALGWSRDQAISTMSDLQGSSVAFISIEADVDRMIASPGKYAAEGLGALALGEWRPQNRALWPAFHRAVLVDGPWPFGELERRLKA